MARIMALSWKYKMVRVSVILVLLQFSATAATSSQQTLAVVPDNDSGVSCHNHFNICHPLEYYIRNAAKYFTSNTIMVFLPGKHVLQSGSVSVLNIHNLTLTSYSFYSQNHSFPNHANINCGNDSGFNFTNVSHLAIKGLTLSQCAQLLPFTIANHTARAALAMKNIENLFMQNVIVQKSIGLGLVADNIFGHSLVRNCIFMDNKGIRGVYGGNVRIVFHDCNERNAHMSIQSSAFEYGSISKYIRNGQATGLQLSIDCSTCSNTTIELDGVVLRENWGNYGGNMAVYFYNCHHCNFVRVSVLNSLIEDGESFVGAGMFVKIISNKEEQHGIYSESNSNQVSLSNKTQTLLVVENTTFQWNRAHVTGGAVCSEHQEVQSATWQVDITFISCNFSNNCAAFEFKYNFPHGGTAIRLKTYHVPSLVPHIYPQSLVELKNCTFSRNYRCADKYNNSNALSAALYVDDHPCISISNSRFVDNNTTAIAAAHSNVIFGGEIIIENNTGGNGGGLVLCDQSTVVFKNHTRVEIVHNTATLGGGIYIDDSCLDARPPCFFQIDSKTRWQHSELNNIVINMERNVAAYGNAIYGGNIDYCFMMYLDSARFHPDKNGIHVFNRIFHISNETSNLTSVTSDPSSICFCNSHSQLSETCYNRQHSIHVYSGGYIELPVVVVGQRWGTVAGSVLATIPSTAEYERTTFSNSQKAVLHKINEIDCKHTNLRFRIFSPPTTVTINLQIQDSSNRGYKDFSYLPLEVNVTVKHCPLGFTLNKDSVACECNEELHRMDYQCDITNQSFTNVKNSWIDFRKAGETETLVYSQNCPLYYCKSNVTVTTSTTDLQCDFNRVGLLCGSCRKGHSVTLGSFKCKKCSNYYLFFVLIFLLSGLLLIAFLLMCNFTVTTGTLSGLIFYANTLDIHRYLITGYKSSPYTYAEVIIGILNLNPPFQTCFYDGMDEYQKIWLEFVFPVYLLFLAGLMIVLSRKYNIVSRMVRKNGTKLLATIFLLSYTKLARAILDVFLLAKYEWKENNETHKMYIWRIDGSIQYWSSRHIIFFVAALTVSLLYVVPYTLVLTFIQPLQMINLRCVNYSLTKFKPLLDAYTAPYKDSRRFWPGLLLVFRLILFAGYIYNEEMPVIVVIVIFSILFFMWTLHGVYKTPLLNTLETSFYLNVGLLALLRIKYEKGDIVHQYSTMILISVIIVTIEFLLIVFYELHKQLLSLSHYRSAWDTVKRRPWRNIWRRNANQREEDNGTIDDSQREELVPFNFPQYDHLRDSILSYELTDHDTS